MIYNVFSAIAFLYRGNSVYSTFYKVTKANHRSQSRGAYNLNLDGEREEITWGWVGIGMGNKDECKQIHLIHNG